MARQTHGTVKGAELNRRHADLVRRKIQASLLIKRLQDYSLGEDGELMTQAQVRAAIGLLDKVLPNRTENHNTHDVGESLSAILRRALARE
jgi:hypothetical protein